MDDAINNPILSVMVQAVISPEELIHVYNTENIFFGTFKCSYSKKPFQLLNNQGSQEFS